MRNIEEQIIASLQADHFSRLANKPIRQSARPYQICLVEPINVFDRSQPVSVEVIPLEGKKVEMLTLKTPLGKEDSFQELLSRYYGFQFPYEQEYPMVKMCYNPAAPAEDIFRVYMRIDIPLMPFIEEENPLSNYELNEALKDLVECGDLIERLALSGQDIKGMDMRKGLPIAPSREVARLRSSVFREELGQDWERSFNPKFVFLNDNLTDNLTNTDLWSANHQYPFVKFVKGREGTDVNLVFFAKDLQLEEQDFLARHFVGLIKQLKQKDRLLCTTN